MSAQLQAIGLVVSDLAASLRFYRTLGLPIPEGAESEDHVDLALEGGVQLMWDTVDLVRSVLPDWAAPSGSSRVALAFALPDPGAVDALYDKLVAAGYHGHKAPWDAFWGQRYAIVRDPDGNGVDLFAPLADSS